MSLFKGEVPEVGHLKIVNKDNFEAPSARIFYGTASTRAAVRAEVDTGAFSVPIGSMYISSVTGSTTTPKVYIKRAAAGATTDWERIVTAAAD